MARLRTVILVARDNSQTGHNACKERLYRHQSPIDIMRPCGPARAQHSNGNCKLATLLCQAITE